MFLKIQYVNNISLSCLVYWTYRYALACMVRVIGLFVDLLAVWSGWPAASPAAPSPSPHQRSQVTTIMEQKRTLLVVHCTVYSSSSEPAEPFFSATVSADSRFPKAEFGFDSRH